MNLEKRIRTFTILGKIIRDSLEGIPGEYTEKFNKLIHIQQYKNPWFTPENVRTALEATGKELTEENLSFWTRNYPVIREVNNPLTTGLIFAGNIPLAGFHDFLTVLISGNRLIAKTSSKDPDLIPFLSNIICIVSPEFSKKIEFATGTLSGFDSVIATGSNNSSRYFEYYFGRYPHVIRKNRNSIAVISGDETGEELKELGKDIFTYFGMGCRNVSKLYVPEGYDINSLPPHWKRYSDCINHSGYANNYDYNKAIYLVNRQKFHDAGFLLMREDPKLASPVSVLHYEYYNSADAVKQQTENMKESIQCIIGTNFIPFGHSQLPHLWDYADGIDTMEFLLKKNLAGIL